MASSSGFDVNGYPAKVYVPENIECDLPVACKNVIGVDAQEKSHGNEDHMSDKCDKRIIAEVETDYGELTAGHEQSKCNKEQQASLNIKNIEKEMTWEEVDGFFGYDHRACTCEHADQGWKDYLMNKFESSIEEPESPLMEEPEWLVDTGPATREFAWRKFLESTYDPPPPGTRYSFSDRSVWRYDHNRFGYVAYVLSSFENRSVVCN